MLLSRLVCGQDFPCENCVTVSQTAMGMTTGCRNHSWGDAVPQPSGALFGLQQFLTAPSPDTFSLLHCESFPHGTASLGTLHLPWLLWGCPWGICSILVSLQAAGDSLLQPPELLLHPWSNLGAQRGPFLLLFLTQLLRLFFTFSLLLSPHCWAVLPFLTHSHHPYSSYSI